MTVDLRWSSQDYTLETLLIFFPFEYENIILPTWSWYHPKHFSITGITSVNGVLVAALKKLWYWMVGDFIGGNSMHCGTGKEVTSVSGPLVIWEARKKRGTVLYAE